MSKKDFLIVLFFVIIFSTIMTIGYSYLKNRKDTFVGKLNETLYFERGENKKITAWASVGIINIVYNGKLDDGSYSFIINYFNGNNRENIYVNTYKNFQFSMSNRYKDEFTIIEGNSTKIEVLHSLDFIYGGK